MNTKNLETSTKKAWNVQIILKRAQKFQNFLLVSHSDYFVCFRILSIYATCFVFQILWYTSGGGLQI